MSVIPQYVRGPSRFVEDCIAIDGDGRRFHDEAGPYLERVAALMQQPGAIGYYFWDTRAAERNAQHIAEIPGTPKRFDDLAGVARAVGCDASTLAVTVDRWNALVASDADKDPDFGRVIFPAERTGIETPPYFVIPMVLGVGGTNGGARVSIDMAVRRQSGEVIPGLFAVGDCASGVNCAVGLGGVHLGSAVTLGRVAGRSVAQA
jgi:succinate dehydrogenase/fumarate reductase flavoprotein subunit